MSNIFLDNGILDVESDKQNLLDLSLTVPSRYMDNGDGTCNYNHSWFDGNGMKNTNYMGDRTVGVFGQGMNAGTFDIHNTFDRRTVFSQKCNNNNDYTTTFINNTNNNNNIGVKYADLINGNENWRAINSSANQRNVQCNNNCSLDNNDGNMSFDIFDRGFDNSGGLITNYNFNSNSSRHNLFAGYHPLTNRRGESCNSNSSKISGPKRELTEKLGPETVKKITFTTDNVTNRRNNPDNNNNNNMIIYNDGKTSKNDNSNSNIKNADMETINRIKLFTRNMMNSENKPGINHMNENNRMNNGIENKNENSVSMDNISSDSTEICQKTPMRLSIFNNLLIHDNINNNFIYNNNNNNNNNDYNPFATSTLQVQPFKSQFISDSTNNTVPSYLPMQDDINSLVVGNMNETTPSGIFANKKNDNFTGSCFNAASTTDNNLKKNEENKNKPGEQIQDIKNEGDKQQNRIQQTAQNNRAMNNYNNNKKHNMNNRNTADGKKKEQRQITTSIKVTSDNLLDLCLSQDGYTVVINEITSKERGDKFIDSIYARLAYYKIFCKVVRSCYGNYVFQELTKKLRDEQALKFLMLISKNGNELFELSQNKYATHCVQALIRRVSEIEDDNENKKTALNAFFKCLMLRANDYIRGKIPYNVILKVFAFFEEPYITPIIDYVMDNMVVFGLDQIGCIIVKKMLELNISKKFTLLDAIADNVYTFSENEYGNYIIQKCLEECRRGNAYMQTIYTKIVESIVPKLSTYCLDKYASNIIELILKTVSGKLKSSFISSIVNCDNIKEIIADQYGNYVIQVLVSTCSKKVKDYLDTHVGLPKKGCYGRVASETV